MGQQETPGGRDPRCVPGEADEVAGVAGMKRCALVASLQVLTSPKEMGTAAGTGRVTGETTSCVTVPLGSRKMRGDPGRPEAVESLDVTGDGSVVGMMRPVAVSNLSVAPIVGSCTARESSSSMGKSDELG